MNESNVVWSFLFSQSGTRDHQGGPCHSLWVLSGLLRPLVSQCLCASGLLFIHLIQPHLAHQTLLSLGRLLNSGETGKRHFTYFSAFPFNDQTLYYKSHYIGVDTEGLMHTITLLTDEKLIGNTFCSNKCSLASMEDHCLWCRKNIYKSLLL